MSLPAALFVPSGRDTFEATALTIGPWDPGLQHAGPPAALLLRAVERASDIEGMTVRLAYDILGPVPVGRVGVRARVLRPGRRVELLEAELDSGDDRPLMRLTAWRIRTRGDDLGSTSPPPHRPADARAEQARFFTEDVAYHRALEWRFAHGTFNAPGPAAAWTRPACALVEGESIAPQEHLLVMADAASGISAVLDWTRFTFVNVDLVVTLAREPRGEWMCMDAETHPGGTGAGACLARLYDGEGYLGGSAQSLLVERRNRVS